LYPFHFVDDGLSVGVDDGLSVGVDIGLSVGVGIGLSTCLLPSLLLLLLSFVLGRPF